MTIKELRAKETELRQLIAQYRINNCNYQAQIAINEREITMLNQQIIELHNEYAQQFKEEE